MIIVKTKGGDIFLDDKVYFYIEHLKSKRMISGKRNGADLTINDVESVRYINDTQATDYKDEGSELENMTTKADLLEAKARRCLEVSGYIRSLLLHGTDLLRLISEKQPQEDFVEEMEWIARDVKKYLAEFEEVLSGSVKSIYEQINNLDEGLRNVTTDGSV
jgi:hypothetical protein